MNGYTPDPSGNVPGGIIDWGSQLQWTQIRESLVAMEISWLDNG